MYTWGYIKDAALANLDLTQEEAIIQNLLNRFHIYANEAITEICSAIKPKHTFAEFVIKELYKNEQGEDVSDIGKLYTMPSDFISFGDDVNTRLWISPYNDTHIAEAHDEDFLYKGYNQVVFWKEGTYQISYNARWIVFSPNMDNYVKLEVPADILECIPLYIAAKCYGIDDEYKASKYRNEYEMALARIDDTHYKQTKTFKIDGGW
jgi:hypothetical protein